MLSENKYCCCKMFSFQSKVGWITIDWMSGLMWRAYKKGLTSESVFQLPEEDDCKVNADILSNLWTQEKKTRKDSSLSKVVLIFAKKQLIGNLFLMTLASITQFLGPVSNELTFETCFI